MIAYRSWTAVGVTGQPSVGRRVKTIGRSRAIFGDPDEDLTARAASGEDICTLKETEFFEYVGCAYANILNLDWKAHFPLYITVVLAILVLLKFLKTAPIITKKAARKFHSYRSQKLRGLQLFSFQRSFQ